MFLFSAFALSCSNEPGPVFSRLKAENTGIIFQNTIPIADSGFNILDYIYYYNGGGVAVGDLNNDGLTDIFFTSNLNGNSLYLNKGNITFEDISATAGIKGKSNWNTGVTLVDINNDGLLDIYVCAVGDFKKLKGRNELFINNGDLTFTESAIGYGLGIKAFSTQATFFDYDKDGDLDMFLVCHSVHSAESFKNASARTIPDSLSGDKLFRNDTESGKIVFREVTTEAGIYNSALGYGLNVMVGDFNNDNWEDIYVSNDFHENDYYYLNNRNGSFSEKNKDAFGHESRFSMGSDVADLNNDGWLDIVTLDMLPQDEKVLKSSASDDPLDVYRYKMSYGYHTQYSRNNLQLNVGAGNYFSDIALYSGIEATDWSWAVLAADFNNDGIKDLFISNGIAKRPNDLDYVKFTSNTDIFNALQKGKSADRLAISRMPDGQVANYIFEGSADLIFKDRSDAWGFNEPGLSNGAAYADLDNDGDLDLVINNMNSEAMVYRNNSRELNQGNYLDLQLLSKGANKNAYGAKVIIKVKGKPQYNYLTASRGFLSASTNILHFGLGNEMVIDTLHVIWPSGRFTRAVNVPANKRLVMYEEDATALPAGVGSFPETGSQSASVVFKDISGEVSIDWTHRENQFVDFNVQPMIPHMLSTEGPGISTADINGDGLDDFFVCGARDQASVLFIQQEDGKFIPAQQEMFTADSVSEDVCALFFDANGDGSPDLYVCTGGNEFSGKEKPLLDRLYVNNGKGHFRKSQGLPIFYGNNSVAAVSDMDKDGDLDLFVGGRVVGGKYGENPESFLLLNDGKGNFVQADDSKAPGLNKIGMVTDATWADMNNDGWTDLVVVGEWMPVTIFMNTKGVLKNTTKAAGLQQTKGLWLSVLAADLDDNGFPELIVGNLGENSKLKATKEYPLHLYVGDIDNNGSFDQLLAHEKNGNYYAFLNKEDLEKQFTSNIRSKYEGYAKMAGKKIEEVFGSGLNNMRQLSAVTLSSVIIQNSGSSYRVERLPDAIQWFPLYACLVEDFNSDGIKDMLCAGNFFGVNPYEGNYDAGFGQLLMGSPRGWQTVRPVNAGLHLTGEVRAIRKLRSKNDQSIYLASRNNDSLVVLKR